MRDRYASLRKGLVGAWIPSVSGSGLLLPDLSGNGNNGALTNMGSEDWVSWQYGRALDFDGVDDYVNYGNKNNLANTAFSISFWLAWPAAIAQSNKGIIAKWDVATRRSWAITTANTVSNIPELNNAGTVVFYYQSNAGSFNASEAIGTVGLSVDDGIWRHFVAVFVPSTKSQWFVNGSLLRTRTTSIPASVSSTISEFWIGAFVAGFFDGQLDDVRIYNRVLSEPEIKLLASRPGIGLRPQRRTMYYAPPTGARRRRILTSMP